MPSGTTARKTVPLLERRKIISLVREAVANGAWKSQACRCIGISIRTLQRWTNDNVITEFASLPPNVIVPTLADRGTYDCF